MTTKNRQSENPAQISNRSLDRTLGKDKNKAMISVTTVSGQPICGAARFRNPASGSSDSEKCGQHTAIKNPRPAIQASGAFPFQGFIVLWLMSEFTGDARLDRAASGGMMG